MRQLRRPQKSASPMRSLRAFLKKKEKPQILLRLRKRRLDSLLWKLHKKRNDFA